MMNELTKKVLKLFPFPIAVVYSRLLREEILNQKGKVEYQKLFYTLIDLFEIINRFLSILILADYHKNGAFDENLNKRISEKINKKMSLGDWHEILRETLKVFGKEQKNLFVPELFSFYYTRKGNEIVKTLTAKQFDDIINIRNKKKGHTLSLTQNEYKALYLENKEKIIDILTNLEFLTNYTLITPIEFDNKEIRYYQVLRGTSIEENFDKIIIDITLNEGVILLADDKNLNNLLILSPLTYWEISYDDMEQYICLYEENRLTKEVVNQLSYIGLTQSAKNKSIIIKQEEESYFNLFELFKRLLTLIHIHSSVTLETVLDKPILNYYFYGQKALIDYHNKFFIGRIEAIQEINDFLRKSNSGYLYIEGFPGQGKSALLSSLVKSYNYPHHFISANEGRDEVKNIIQSVFFQIAEEMKTESYQISIDVEKLKRDFNNLLFQYAEWCRVHQKKSIVLIDALDELKLENRKILVSYLPEYVPENLFILFTSRPEKELNYIESRINVKIRLNDLSFEEVKQIILTKSKQLNNDLIIQIFNSSRGNPLLLNGILNEIDYFIENGKIIKKIPVNIENIFTRLIIDLRSSKDSTSFEILGLLVVANGGLSGHEIAKILSKSKFQVLQSTKSIFQYLIINNNKYSIYHKKLIDYLLNPQNEYGLDNDEIVNYHKIIINYCEKSENRLSIYSTRYLLSHYFALDKIDKIEELVKTKEYSSSFVDLITELLIRVSSISDVEKERLEKIINQIIKAHNELSHFYLIESFENAIYYGIFDFCHEFLLKLKTKYSVSNKHIGFIIEYLIARITREQGKLDSALNMLKELNKNIPHDFDKNYLMKIKLEYANTCREFGTHEIAIKYYNEALDLCSNETSLDIFLEINLHLSDLIYVRGDFKKALEELNKGLDLAEEKHMELRKGQLNRIIGQIYYASEFFEESLNFYYNALISFSKLNDEINLGKIYNSISLSECYLNFEKAEEYVDLGLKINTKLGRDLEIAKGYLNLAILNSHKKNFNKSVEYSDLAINKFKNVGYQSGYASAFHYKAKTLYRIKDYSGALSFIEQSNKILYKRKPLGDPFYIIKNQILASIIHEKLNNLYLKDKCLENLPTLNTILPKDNYIDRFKKHIISDFPI